MKYLIQNESQLKKEYPLVCYFLQQQKYKKANILKNVFQWLNDFYLYPFQNFFFYIKLYFHNKCSKLQTYYYYLSSLISFFLKSKFQWIYQNNSRFTTIPSTFNSTTKILRLRIKIFIQNFYSPARRIDYLKYLKNKRIIIISIIIIILMIMSFLFWYQFYFKKIKRDVYPSNNTSILQKKDNINQTYQFDRFSLLLDGTSTKINENNKELLICMLGIHYYDITGLFINTIYSSGLLMAQINQCNQLEKCLCLKSSDRVADFNFGWCGYGRYFCQKIPNLQWHSCFHHQQRVQLVKEIIHRDTLKKWPKLYEKHNFIHTIQKNKLSINKLLWIDFQYYHDRDILKILLKEMKNLKFPTNLKNEQNDPAGLIYLEFTMINNEEGYATASTSSIDDNAINQKKDFNTMIGGKSIPEAWTLSQYLNFLKEYPIYKINEPLSFHQQLIMLNVSKTDVKKCIDISLDYEKTLWCWCYRLKQAIDLNTKNDTLDDDDPASSIYLSFLLQTVALFQQQKLKRYQLLFSF